MLAIHPDHPVLLGHFAGALAYRGDHGGALRCYDRFLGIAPDSIEARWRRADRLVNLGRLDDALAAYRDVLEVEPENTDARMGVRYVEYLRRRGRAEGIFLGSRRPALSPLQEKNRALNRKEFEENRVRLRSMPHRLYLESTLKCNFACLMCSKGQDAYYAEDLQEEIDARTRREVMPYITRISITGFGEPTMAGNFDTILDRALENGSEVFFVTNASLLNFERLEKLASRPVEIIISIDGATRETFEKIRVNSNFHLILEKLAMIRKLRDIAMSDFVSHFSIHFVGLQMNIHELAGVVRLAHEYRIHTVGLLDYAFNDVSFDEQSLRYDPKRANKHIDEARAVAGELGIHLSTPPRYEENPPPLPWEAPWRKLLRVRRLFSARDRFARRCSSPWCEPYVHTNGDVTPCCTSNDYLGSLKKQEFRSIWNGWRFRLLRLRIHSPVPPISCRTCFNHWGINGGNAGNAMAREGLFVKLFYWAEHRFRSLLWRWRRWRGGATGAAPPEPNFHLGRPMKAGEKPGTPSGDGGCGRK